jgi:hypothetical protein
MTRCDDCGRDWCGHASPIFHDRIWRAMGMKKDQLLCVDCAYRRLYRPCPFNTEMGIKVKRHPNRLRKRSGRRRWLYRTYVRAGQLDLLRRTQPHV